MKPGLLIHYGSIKYDARRFEPIKNDWVKPNGGLWTSPVNSEWSWKHWCEAEHFRECDIKNSFVVKLKESAKILIIDSLNDLKNLPLLRKYNKDYPDFEIIQLQYDAIWLTERGQNETHLSRPLNLYGWDCESVLILNAYCFKEVSITIKRQAKLQAQPPLQL